MSRDCLCLKGKLLRRNPLSSYPSQIHSCTTSHFISQCLTGMDTSNIIQHVQIMLINIWDFSAVYWNRVSLNITKPFNLSHWKIGSKPRFFSQAMFITYQFLLFLPVQLKTHSKFSVFCLFGGFDKGWMAALSTPRIGVSCWRASWSPRADQHALCFTGLQRKWASLHSSADYICFLCSFFATQFLFEKQHSINRNDGKQSQGKKQQLRKPPLLKGTGQAQVLLPPTPVEKQPAVASL